MKLHLKLIPNLCAAKQLGYSELSCFWLNHLCQKSTFNLELIMIVFLPVFHLKKD